MKALIKIISSSLLCVMMQNAFANANTFQVCPTVDELKTYILEGSAPIGFDAKSHEFKYLMFFSSTMPEYEDTYFMLSPIKMTPGETPETSMRDIFDNLQQNNETPITSTIYDAEDYSNNMTTLCSYSLPNDATINAIVVYVPSESTTTEYTENVQAKNVGISHYMKSIANR